MKKSTKVCVWENKIVSDMYITGCKDEGLFTNEHVEAYTYCPLCGKRIKELIDAKK